MSSTTISSATAIPVSPPAGFSGERHGLPLGSAPLLPKPRLLKSRLRLTARGRAVLSALVALPLVIGLVLGAQQAVAGSGSPADAAAFHYVTVEAGQTLWALAGELAPSADPREVVAEIAQLNRLGSTAIQPGQRLAIPRAYTP